jgi:VWFA-related protein
MAKRGNLIPEVMHVSTPASRAGLAIAAVLFTTAIPALGDESGAPKAGNPAEPPPEGPVVEHVEVRFFEFPVLVRDTSGRPVSGLAAEDLVLRVDGRDHEIANVWPVEAPESKTTLPDVHLAIDGVAQGDPAATSPGESEHYILFIDLANDPPPKRGDAATELIAPLKRALRSHDLVAVVSYNGTLTLELPFTADRDLIEKGVGRALDRSRPNDAGTTMRMSRLTRQLRACNFVPDNPFTKSEDARQERSLEPGGPAADQGCVRSLKSSYRSERLRRAKAYLDALAGAAGLAGGIEGHVTILAVSHGDGLDPDLEFAEALSSVFGARQAALVDTPEASWQSVRETIAALLHEAARERASFVFVDPSSAPPPLAAGQATPGTSGADPAGAAYRASLATLQEIADQTAGLVVVDRDLGAGLEQAIEAEAGRYVVTFYRDSDLGTDHPPEIEVRARRQGLEVLGGGLLDASGEEQRWIPAAMAFGESRARADGKPGAFVPFVVGVRQGDMDYESSGDEMVVSMSLHVALQTIEGRELVEQYQVLSHSVPKSDWDEASGQTLRVRGSFEAPDGDYMLGAMFRNPRTGKKAVVYREVKIPVP